MDANPQLLPVKTIAMADHVIIAEPYGSVLADETVPCVIVQFHQFANSNEFRHMMTTGLNYYQAHRTPQQPWGWVGDIRHMGAIPQDVQQWLVTQWNIAAYEAGIREFSLVAPANVLGQFAAEQYTQHTAAEREQYAIEPVYYASLAEAKAGAAKRCAALKADGGG